MKHSLEGQAAIITGGARGIGLATAQYLAGEGCRTILWDVNFDGIEAAAKGFKPSLMQVVDVTKPELDRAGVCGRAIAIQAD